MESSHLFDQVVFRYVDPARKSRKQVLEYLWEAGIDIDFIYALLEIFENDRNFSSGLFQDFSVETIIDYIQRTHKYYLSGKLLEIERSIDLLLQDYNGDHPLLLILRNFYQHYVVGLTAHINTEETSLLPYINYLLVAEVQGFDLNSLDKLMSRYSLKKFVEEHEDTEGDLKSVRETIKLYNPPLTNQTPYRILLSQLESFEKDLEIHALIEDRVLIPRALILEDSLRIKILEKARLN